MPSMIESLVATTSNLRNMPRREIRALQQKPYCDALEQLVEELGDEEPMSSLSCATSASRGRGVMGLTQRRLVLFTTQKGLYEWPLATIDAVRGRPAKFTMPAAIYLETQGSLVAVVVGAGRAWGPVFTSTVRDALHLQTRDARAS